MENVFIKINGKISQSSATGENTFEVTGKIEHKKNKKECALKKFCRRIFNKRVWDLDMDNIELQVNEDIYQVNLSGKNSIKIVGKAVDESTPEKDDGKSVEKKQWCKPDKYTLLLLKITGFAIVFFLFAIALNKWCGFGITDSSIVIAFIGVLATFVVVSNYMQVQEIRKEFDAKIKNTESDLKEEINTRIDLKSNELEAHITYAISIQQYRNKDFDMALMGCLVALERYVKFDLILAESVLDYIIKNIIYANDYNFNNRYTAKEKIECKKCAESAYMIQQLEEKALKVINFIDNLSYKNE
jgi:hypothetical protein